MSHKTGTNNTSISIHMMIFFLLYTLFLKYIMFAKVKIRFCIIYLTRVGVNPYNSIKLLISLASRSVIKSKSAKVSYNIKRFKCTVWTHLYMYTKLPFEWLLPAPTWLRSDIRNSILWPGNAISMYVLTNLKSALFPKTNEYIYEYV